MDIDGASDLAQGYQDIIMGAGLESGSLEDKKRIN